MIARGSILIVDDNDDLRQLLADLLREHGYEVITAADGLRALELLRTAAKKPSLVLLDLHMPLADGWHVVDAMRRQDAFAAIPVVVHTAEERTPPGGIAQLIRKPIEPAALLALARRYCG